MVRIGTSGFYYEHWRGVLYPEGVGRSRWFELYAREFDTVEMNSTFYHLPRARTVEHWGQKAPEGFLFSFKAPRSVTHYKKLREVREELLRFLHLLKPIKAKIASLLFQLPPSLHRDEALLGEFLAELPHGGGWRYALEFRHESWYVESVYGILRHHGAALVQHDYGRREVPEAATGPFGYLRLHGPDGHYRGSYDDAALERWAEIVREHAAHHRPVFVYFNNDLEGNAVRDARRLRSLLAAEGFLPKESFDCLPSAPDIGSMGNPSEASTHLPGAPTFRPDPPADPSPGPSETNSNLSFGIISPKEKGDA
jgi:uncharacterized protein YecE (DUF72 family)